MLPSWFNLNAQIVSQSKVLAFISMIKWLAIVHKINSFLCESQLMKWWWKILDGRIFFLSMLNGFEVKLKGFEEVTFFSFCFFCFFVKVISIIMFRILSVAIVSIVFSERILERSDQRVDLCWLFLICRHLA